MSLFERSLGVVQIGPGRWRALASPDYQGMNGLFGGWSAALLLSGVLAEAGGDETPASLTTHFLAPVLPERPLEIRVDRARSGRSLSFWQATLTEAGGSEPIALATAVLASRRESDRFDELHCPGAPDPAQLERFIIGGQPFGQRMDIRPASASPPFGLNDSRSLAWIREMSGRPVDAVQLAFLSDVGAPRIFYYSPGPRPMSTITLSTYFHATPDELAAVGDDFLLSELTGTRAARSTFGSRGQLFSRAGALLATMEQLCWFK